jgi:hypothetical protein
MVDRSAAAKKAAKTRKFRAAARKAAETKKRRAAAKKAVETRKLRAAGRKAAETKKGRAAAGLKTRSIRWLNVEGRDMERLGHGVEFFHAELESIESRPIAFLEGFGWRGNRPATVRVLQTPPDSVASDHWLKILDETREAVLAFLSDEDNFLDMSFRHGPIGMVVNC